MITRFAPTPSGYLHLGNAVNAQLVAWLAAQHDGRMVLRIDDMDAPRSRPEYVDDVFDLLHWLGLVWQDGPRDSLDFAARHSQQARRSHYWSELEAARSNGLEVYACACTRTMRTGPATGGCPGGCRAAGLEYEETRTALRVHVPLGTSVLVGDEPVALDTTMGDFVVWRRDGLPTYQLVSVIEDREAGTTHLVRGEDLRESTAAQLFLAPSLQARDFTGATFLHHGLVVAADGSKLSKSQASSGPLARTDRMRDLVRERAEAMGRPLGISSPR